MGTSVIRFPVILSALLSLAAASAASEAPPRHSSASRAQRLTLECERDLVAAKHLIPSLAHLPSDARRLRKLEFARTPQGPLHLDLYLPASAAGRPPLIVWPEIDRTVDAFFEQHLKVR